MGVEGVQFTWTQVDGETLWSFLTEAARALSAVLQEAMEINRETENAGSQRVALAALPDQIPVRGLEDSKAEAGSFATNDSGSGNSGMDGASSETEQVLNWAKTLRRVEEAVQGGPAIADIWGGDAARGSLRALFWQLVRPRHF